MAEEIEVSNTSRQQAESVYDALSAEGLVLEYAGCQERIIIILANALEAAWQDGTVATKTTTFLSRIVAQAKAETA